MRGSHLVGREAHHPLGIIPAHAGLTEGLSGHIADAGDHPRACGAHDEQVPLD